jgi:ribonuclease P protein component
VQKVGSVLPQPTAQNSSKIKKGFLKRRIDFLKTYKGRFVRQELFILYGRKNDSSGHRFGITAPKTMGSAVIRNRFKRWSKELYRKINLDEVRDPLDLNVFLGNKRLKKEDFKNAAFKEFAEQFDKSMQSLIGNFK